MLLIAFSRESDGSVQHQGQQLKSADAHVAVCSKGAIVMNAVHLNFTYILASNNTLKKVLRFTHYKR